MSCALLMPSVSAEEPGTTSPRYAIVLVSWIALRALFDSFALCTGTSLSL
jgi:hypothetical protein